MGDIVAFRRRLPPELVRWSSYLVGVCAATGTTLALFVVFTHSAAPAEVGTYALVSAICGVPVRIIDGCVTYAHLALKRPVTQYHARMLPYVAGMSGSAAVAAAGASLVGSNLIPAVLFGASQSAWVTMLSGAVLSGSPRRVLWTQLVNAGAFAAAIGLTLIVGAEALTASEMLEINAGASTLAVVAAAIALRVRPTRSAGPRLGIASMVSWAPLHGMNALTTGIDSIVLGAADRASLVAFQAVQRPMLGLGALNAAIGQWALGRLTQLRPAILLSPPMLIPYLAWPIIGVAVAELMNVALPPAVEVSRLAAVVLSLAFAVGATAQVTGALLVRVGARTAHAVSAGAQLVTLVGALALFVPKFAVLGACVGVLLSRIVLVLGHFVALRIRRSG